MARYCTQRLRKVMKDFGPCAGRGCALERVLCGEISVTGSDIRAQGEQSARCRGRFAPVVACRPKREVSYFLPRPRCVEMASLPNTMP